MSKRRNAATVGAWLSSGLLLALVLPGCGGGGGGGTTATIPLGVGTPTASQEVPQQILRNEGYRMERADGPPNIYIRTEWRVRSPFPSEEALGVTEARTRIIVDGRARGSDINQLGLFNMRMRAENEGRTPDSPGFTSLEATDDFTDYVNGIAREIRDNLEMGIRME